MNPRHRRSPKNLTVDYLYGHVKTNTLYLKNPSKLAYGPFFIDKTDVIIPTTEKFYYPWNDNPQGPIEEGIADDFNKQLNYLYSIRSGNKFASSIAYKVPTKYEYEGERYLSAQELNRINYRIRLKYLQKWKHLWDLYTAEYDPLHSYTVDETRTREVTGTDTGTVGNSGTGSSSKSYPTKSNSSTRQTTPNITETLTGTDRDVVSGETETVTTPDTVTTTRKSEDGTGQNNRFAFNTVAENGVPVTKDTTKITSTDTQEVDGTETVETTDSRTDTLTLSESKVRTGSESESLQSTESYTGAEAKTESASNTETRNLAHGEEETVTSSRAGNMFKSFASLMEDDRNFWMTEYFDIVFDDVDKLLTLDIYSESEIHTYVW